MQIIRLSILFVSASLLGLVVSFAESTPEQIALLEALEQIEKEYPPTETQRTMHYVKVSVELLEFFMLLAGSLLLLKTRKDLGPKLMAAAMGTTALLVPLTVIFETQISRWNTTYLPIAFWGITTLVFSSGFMIFSLNKSKAYQGSADNGDKRRV